MPQKEGSLTSAVGFNGRFTLISSFSTGKTSIFGENGTVAILPAATGAFLGENNAILAFPTGFVLYGADFSPLGFLAY